MSEIGLYAAMSTLRAVRRLRPDPIPDEVLERVVRAATWAPSGGNRQPWRIVAVRDRRLVARLGELYQPVWEGYAQRSRSGIRKLPEASRARWEPALRAGDYLAEHFHETPAVLVFCFDPDRLAVTAAC